MGIENIDYDLIDERREEISGLYGSFYVTYTGSFLEIKDFRKKQSAFLQGDSADQLAFEIATYHSFVSSCKGIMRASLALANIIDLIKDTFNNSKKEDV